LPEINSGVRMSKNNVVKFDENVLKDRIYSIRGFQVMYG
jgi:hypothetical protein